MEPLQPPTTPPPVTPPTPLQTQYALTTADKLIFAFFFTAEVLFFLLYSGCTLMFVPMIGPSPLLLPIPVLFFFHFQAFRAYKALQTNPTKGMRIRMFCYLLLPVAFIVLVAFVVPNLLGGF